MRVTFSIDFDGGCWPGALGGEAAAFGEAWIGPGGLLGLLETSLGLRGPTEAPVLRVAGLIPAVQTIEGFWSESAAHNPLAAARTLLAWRDALWMCGWRGQPLRPRLEALAQVTAEAAPGFPDRLVAVHGALLERPAEIESLALCEPRDQLAPLWQKVVAALESHGTEISSCAMEPAVALGDLAAVRARGFDAEADGSLQLLRPYGPQAAAEEVAVWLAAHDDLAGTVIIGGDPLLDAALERHGLPTLGASSNAPTSALLQLLPLVLSLGWDPPDPRLALELLTSSLCPLPRAVADRLASALAQWPAVGSPAWDDALQAGLETIEDESQRARVATRCAALFEARVTREGRYPLAEIRRRLELLTGWLSARAETDETASVPWWAATAQSATLLGIVERSGLEALLAAQLERFVQAATDSVELPPTRTGQAGLVQVPRPGSIVGPAQRVVWWSFDLGSAPPIRGLPVSSATREALAAEGIAVPDPGLQALAMADRWRRPLAQATEALLLVCPQRSADGEDRYPHPLWDELVGQHGEETLQPLEVESPIFPSEPSKRSLACSPPPAPRRDWQVAPVLLGWRDTESPSGLASLMGCSLQWALRYHARLEKGRSLAIPGAALVLGNLLHETVEAVLLQKPESPDAARAAALELFDEIVASRAATLVLPGAESERQRIRRHAGEAAADLTRLLADARLEVRQAEATLKRPWLEGNIGGRIDLLLGDPPAVLDLKLGGSKGRRQELEAGTADSLAIYSHLVAGEAGQYPPVGFYILVEQTLLTTEADRFPGAEPLEGPGPHETWTVVDRTAQTLKHDIATGVLAAQGIQRDPDEKLPEQSEVVDGLLVRPAPCRYCDFAVLCGRQFAEEVR